jgi:uncharacterized protein YecE (DUF72 family)
MKNSTGRIHIGTSGWVYRDWEGTFYPVGIRPNDWFGFYSRQFSTVEINATFYHLPNLKTVHGWRDKAPPRFLFAVKGSRFITHIKKLADLGDAPRRFFRRIAPMRERIGVVLWQLPPSLKKDAPRLEQFLARLPRSFRHAVEFRDPSWLDEDIFGILRRYGDALVSISSWQMPMNLTVTADFVYLRFHGLAGGARHDYSRAELEPWAKHICQCAHAGKTVYAYFNNDLNARAPGNAKLLRQMVQANKP